MAPAPMLYGKGKLAREFGHSSVGDLVGGVLCLDFINTSSNQPGAGGYDPLSPGYLNVVEWCSHAGIVDVDTAQRLLLQAGKEPREAAAVRKRAIALRAALFEIVTTMSTGEEPASEPMALFNQEVQRSFASGRLDHDGAALAWRWNDGSDLDRMLWEVARSAADLLASSRLVRVKHCAAPACQCVFLDTSKNGSRRYCSSATCGTADRVRRFRARRKTGSS